jgi:hypothetical protein
MPHRRDLHRVLRRAQDRLTGRRMAALTGDNMIQPLITSTKTSRYWRSSFISHTLYTRSISVTRECRFWRQLPEDAEWSSLCRSPLTSATSLLRSADPAQAPRQPRLQRARRVMRTQHTAHTRSSSRARSNRKSFEALASARGHEAACFTVSTCSACSRIVQSSSVEGSGKWCATRWQVTDIAAPCPLRRCRQSATWRVGKVADGAAHQPWTSC